MNGAPGKFGGVGRGVVGPEEVFGGEDVGVFGGGLGQGGGSEGEEGQEKKGAHGGIVAGGDLWRGEEGNLVVSLRLHSGLRQRGTHSWRKERGMKWSTLEWHPPSSCHASCKNYNSRCRTYIK